ncbi:hypothetical protein STEG23_027823, partial [Scotinomys teguina]
VLSCPLLSGPRSHPTLFPGDRRLLVAAAPRKYQRIAGTDSLAVPFSYAYTSLWLWSKEV